MNGKLIRSRPLYVAFAQRKEDRRTKLQVPLCFLFFFFLFWRIILWIISFFASVFSFAFIFLKKTFHMLHFICLSGTVCNDASNADGSTSSGPTDAYVPSWFGTANFLWLSTPIYSTSGIPVLLLSFTTVFVLINDTLFASS
jgi:hypothetical protein